MARPYEGLGAPLSQGDGSVGVVKALQHDLRALGYLRSGIDGDFAELVVIAGTLSAEDWDAIGTYFEAKFGIDTAFTDPAVVLPAPEPSSFALLGLGVVGLARRHRRRRAVA